MKEAKHKIEYVRWQNRSVSFYIAARLLYLQGIFSPASYCAATTLELLMKATLKYQDPAFAPRQPGHNLQKLVEMVNGASLQSAKIEVPSYFSNESHFNMTSRYPHETLVGYMIPGSFLADLDRLFADFLLLVDYQHNTELVSILANLNGRERKRLVALRRDNQQMRRLRKGLYRWTPPFPKKKKLR